MVLLRVIKPQRKIAIMAPTIAKSSPGMLKPAAAICSVPVVNKE
jgi:hypothetical protein